MAFNLLSELHKMVDIFDIFIACFQSIFKFSSKYAFYKSPVFQVFEKLNKL